MVGRSTCAISLLQEACQGGQPPGEAKNESRARRTEETPVKTSLRHAAAFRTGILAVVAVVLAVRASRLAGTGSGWRPDARNEKRFYGWGYGPRGAAFRDVLADKSGLFGDAEVVCFEVDSPPSGRPEWGAVMASYYLPQAIVIVPATHASAAADPLPCRTRVVVPPDGPLRIERRSLADRRP
jgi:hypothetical protein